MTGGGTVGSSVDAPCLDTKVVDADALTAGPQPDCAFVDHVTSADLFRQRYATGVCSMKKAASILCGALALAACSSSGGKGPGFLPRPDGSGAAGTGAAGTGTGTAGTGAPSGKTYTFRSGLNRDVDILVMVDNSLGMKGLQQKLATSFSALTDVLQSTPGGLPNLHLAVVSSDMGAGPFSAIEIPACRPGGDQGAFQAMPKGPTCANGSLMPGQTFIIATGSGAGNNFTGTLADTLGCIAPTGDTGCGYEHQLASVLRALGADGAGPPPAANANFLRPNAFLFVLLFTNEDDCSGPPDAQLYNPASRFISDPLGPLSSYRCNEFGHLCGGVRPPRTNIPAGGVDLTGTCKSAEDGRLLRIADVAARLKALKPDPSKVFVAAFAGPPGPYVVETGPATLKDDPVQDWPQIRHSCVQPAAAGQPPEYADPAIRIDELVRAFGSNGLFQVMCNDSFKPALTVFGQQVAKAVSPLDCLPAGTDPSTCTFVDHEINDAGMRADRALPSCDSNGGTAPCWLADAGGLCGQGSVVTIRRTAAPAVELTTTATCAR